MREHNLYALANHAERTIRVRLAEAEQDRLAASAIQRSALGGLRISLPEGLNLRASMRLPRLFSPAIRE